MNKEQLYSYLANLMRAYTTENLVGVFECEFGEHLTSLTGRADPAIEGKWTYDEQWDTWRFWRDEDGRNIIKIQRSKSHGLIFAKLREAIILEGETDD